jgi:hypothetical protein
MIGRVWAFAVLSGPAQDKAGFGSEKASTGAGALPCTRRTLWIEEGPTAFRGYG